MKLYIVHTEYKMACVCVCVFVCRVMRESV